MRKIVIINGTGGSGKDSFVSFCSMFAKCKLVNQSTDDKVKEVAKDLGWGGGKDEVDRKFLSDLKKLSTDYNNGPFGSTVMRIETDYNTSLDDTIYFVHCREPEEIEKFVNHFENECATLLIKRENHKTIGNYSDESVENYKYDVVFEFKDGDMEGMERTAVSYINNLI